MTASRSLTGPLFLIAVLLAMTATPVSSASAADGTIKVLKAGDRNPADHTAAGYAVGLAGAVFEYSTSASFAAIAGTFPATDATGAATKSVAPGTYYVREKTAPPGWTDMGPVQSLYFDPSSSTPGSARDYVSTVVVSSGQTTTTYPDRSSSSEQEAGDSGSPFVDVRDNASFPSYCGTKIQLVLDRSGSISSFKDDYKAAVDAFITALDNTPTQIAITSFNTDVNGAAAGGIAEQGPLSLSTPGNAATLKAKVAAIYASPQSGTNWDAALRDAAGRGGFAPTPESASVKPDMIVFITDGNPTVSPTDSDSGDVGLLDLTYGMASANLVKNQVVAGAVKMKMFALGVGDGVTVENLKVVSGPNDDLNADPDYAATSILALTNKLKEIAGRTCGARIVVRKKLVGADNDALARSNWTFAATSGASVSYSDPDDAAPYKTSGSPAQLTVSINAIPAGGTNATVTEDAAGQPLAAGDYGLTGVVCETGQFGSGSTVATTSVTRGFSIDGVALKRNTDLFCTFTNSVLQPNVTLTKTTSTPTVNAGDVARFAVKVQNAGDGPAQNVVVSDILPAGPTWTADGALPAGCVIADVVVASVTRQKVTCTLASLAKDASVTFNVKATTSAAECGTYDNTVTAIAGNQAQIGPDTETVTCLKPPKLIVVKHVVNDDGGTRTAADFTLQIDDPGTNPPDVTGAESPGTPVIVDAGTYSVTEAAQTGYAVTYSADCENTTISFGQTKTCTITNDDIAPTLTVVKHVVNKHGSTATAADFSMQITGTAGTPAPFDGSEVGITKTLAAGTYAVTESGAATADYTQTDSADCSGSLAVGDEMTCTITNTRKTGTITVVKDLIPATDDGRFDLLVDETVVKADAADGDSGSLEVNTGTYTVSEAAGSAGSLGNYAKGISCSNEQSVAGAGPLQVRVGDGAEITCTITNRRVLAQPVVVKAGDTFTYHGDIASYTFAVSNTGNSPLHDVHVTDDKCPTVSGDPTSKSNDNGDALLDPIGADSATPEVWVFTCSYQMGAHGSGEANPVVNTATVTATDELDRQVTDTDRHATTLLHPAIALTKTGPASATAGNRVAYLISASNSGDVAFPAALVVVTDARCEAPPLLIGKGTDASTATFNPGDTWLYACVVQTVVGETAVHNVAAVDGTDVNGRHATAQAAADTRLNAPPAAVLGSGDPVLAPASAKLRGPTGCIPRTGRIVVTGKRIAQVTFTVDGRRKKVVTKADSSGRFVYSVPRSKLRAGTHRVRARVVYLAGSTATAKTLVMTLNRCPAAVTPAFTG